jgi:hypothetical protein
MRNFGLGARGRGVLKCLPGPCQNGGRAGCCFEPPEDHIAVGRIIFDQSGKPPTQPILSDKVSALWASILRASDLAPLAEVRRFRFSKGR